MKQKKWLFVLMFVGAGLVVAALFLYLLFSRQGMILSERVLTPAPAAPVEVTLPPSLDEMAELYPEMAEILTDPELGCVYKDFLLAYHEGGIEGARSLASERGILTPDKLVACLTG